jgi:tetratricopeptide (TPR) repeat protein
MRGMLRAAVAAIVLTLAMTPLATASAQPRPPNTEGLTSQEIADQTEVLAALQDFSKSRYAGLAPHLAKLRTVLDHAPASYPRIELRGDVGIVRAEGPSFPALSLLVMMEAVKAKHDAHAVLGVNIYPLAALLLASNANEQGETDEAMTWLDKGLAMQPDCPDLMTEKGYSLNKLHRPADALAMYERGLAAAHPQDPFRALLFRGKGFALIELKRWDEAEQAYKESQKIDPANPIAQSELKFIADNRPAR